MKPPFREEYWVVRSSFGIAETFDSEAEAIEKYEKWIEDPWQTLVVVEHVKVVRRHWT